MKLREISSNSVKIPGNSWNTVKLREIPWKSLKFRESIEKNYVKMSWNHDTFGEMCRNSAKSREIPWNPKTVRSLKISWSSAKNHVVSCRVIACSTRHTQPSNSPLFQELLCVCDVTTGTHASGTLCLARKYHGVSSVSHLDNTACVTYVFGQSPSVEGNTCTMCFILQ